MTDIEIAVGLLELAQCPHCNGSGTIEVNGFSIVPGCCGEPLGNGECCGNAIPIQEPIQELQPCQWCEERNELVSKYG